MRKAKDCYEVSEERGVTPEIAAQQMREEGWRFDGYNDCGEEVYFEPQVFVIAPEAIGYMAHEEIMSAITFVNPEANVEMNERGGITITL